MAEEVLISVKIDRQGNQNELQRLTGQIIAQKNEVKQLEAAVKTLSKAEGDNTELIKKTTANLELKKQQLNQNVASQKALVNVVNAEVKSLNALRAQNAQLIRQRNQLNIETAEGRSQIQAINAQIDANNAKIAENSSKLEQQKINIGNYASALSGISPGIAGFITGLQGMVTAAKAFLATPLGLALAAIGLVLGPVISFFKDTAVGADLAAREVEGFDFVLTRFKDKFNQLGSELVKGEGATNKFIEVQAKFIKLLAAPLIIPLQGAINKYKELAAAGQEYADTLDDLEDKQKSFSIVEAETENQIKRLALQSKNRTTSEKERVALIDRALALESQLQLKRKGFAEDELSALLKLNKARLDSVGIIQQAGETQTEFAKRAADAIRETTLSGGDELADSFINAVKKLAEVEAQSIALEEKLQNQRDAILDKAEEEAAKRREREEKEKEKAREKQRQAEEEEYEYQKGLIDKAREDEKKRKEEELEEEAAYYKAQEQLNRENANKRIEFERSVANTKISLALQVSNFLQAIAGKNKAIATIGILIEKAAAIAQIIANRGVANMKAIALSPQTLGQPLVSYNNLAAGFSIGATVATAAQQIGEIQGFAKGGIVGNVRKGTPIRRSNGDDVLITARKDETIVTPMQRRIIGEDAFARAGVPGFATGGIVGSATNNAFSQAESRLEVNRLAGLVNNVKTILVLQDFEAKKLQADSIVNEATII